jgi:hypothetical protein
MLNYIKHNIKSNEYVSEGIIKSLALLVSTAGSEHGPMEGSVITVMKIWVPGNLGIFFRR